MYIDFLKIDMCSPIRDYGHQMRIICRILGRVTNVTPCHKFNEIFQLPLDEGRKGFGLFRYFGKGVAWASVIVRPRDSNYVTIILSFLRPSDIENTVDDHRELENFLVWRIPWCGKLPHLVSEMLRVEK